MVTVNQVGRRIEPLSARLNHWKDVLSQAQGLNDIELESIKKKVESVNSQISELVDACVKIGKRPYRKKHPERITETKRVQKKQRRNT